MRAISLALAAHLQGAATTTCYLLKVMPIGGFAATFGLTTLEHDVIYDDGNGAITYKARRGYTSFDIQQRSDLSVDNSQAKGLLAEDAIDGVTAIGIAAGWYDDARFVQYLVNYEDLTMGHVIVNSGKIGQVQNLDDLLTQLELRSLTQIAKQNNLIEQTSITCRADYGDTRCKQAFKWYYATVTNVGAEPDRVFQVDSFKSPQVNNFLMTGDGVTVTAQLKDENGVAVTAHFSVTNITVNGTPLTPGTGYTVNATGLVTFATAPATASTVLWSGSTALSPAGTSAGHISNVLFGIGDGTKSQFQLLDTAGIPVTSGFTVTAVTVNGAAAGYTVNGTGLVSLSAVPAASAEVRWSGTIPLSPDGFFAPGVAEWQSGNNAPRRSEIESFDSSTNTVTLAIPVYLDVQVGDQIRLRQDCDHSWTMCTQRYNNGPNFRGEKDLPRADSNDLMAPSQIS